MKVLLLVQKNQRVMLDGLYAAIQRYTVCDVCWLSSEEQDDLKDWFAQHVDPSHYDRVILFLRFKKEIRQVKFIRTLPNLVILEHDAVQNYLPCKYQGKFSKYYRSLPWARILTSGFTVSKKLQQEGFDAVFVPKGYDNTMLQNQQKSRDIELGFVGSLESQAYRQRKALLESLSEKENIFITRTKSGDEYVNMLNRIRFFVSADAGMGEYMIKNFEAMACGCVLFTWDQGTEENTVLGFKDMENVVLYSSIDELRDKLKCLRNDPALSTRIAEKGQAHAEAYFTFDAIGKRVASALVPPLRQKVEYRRFGVKRYSWKCA